jgi:heme exporter protein A
MIEAIDLSCTRGERLLFSSLSVRLTPGDLLTVLGENGSGKSSLLRILCGLLPPERGAIQWEGKDIGQLKEWYSAQVTYIGHLNGIKDDLTPMENLQISAHLCGDSASDTLAVEALEAVGLGRSIHPLPTRVLSQGQKRRVALARLWLSTRVLWILDEPFASLDEGGAGLLSRRLRRHVEQGGMAVVASHQEVGVPTGYARYLRLSG